MKKASSQGGLVKKVPDKRKRTAGVNKFGQRNLLGQGSDPVIGTWAYADANTALLLEEVRQPRGKKKKTPMRKKRECQQPNKRKIQGVSPGGFLAKRGPEIGGGPQTKRGGKKD